MKRINIQDILDESISYFHFTDESHLYDNEHGTGILNGGLSSIPRDRPHTVGDDKKWWHFRINGCLDKIRI